MAPFGFSDSATLKRLTQRATAAGCLHEEIEYDVVGDDGLVIKYTQDTEPLFERNRELQWDPSFDGYTPSRDMQHVAAIPNVIVSKWLFEEGINVLDDEHWPYVRRKLNDPEYRYLRTGGGRI